MSDTITEEDNPKFEIVSDISKSLKKMLKHIDSYQLNFHIDFIYEKLTIVGVSPNKSKLVSIVTKFNTCYFDNQNKTYFNFVCRIPEFTDYKKFKIIKDGDNVSMGNDKITKAIFYEEQLYTDWSGTGESMYDHNIEVKSAFLKEKIESNDSQEIKFIVDQNKKVYMIIGEDRYFIGNTIKSKNSFDKVDYSIIAEDLIEVIEDSETFIMYLNKDCPILLKKKTEEDIIKGSYTLYALV